ncbi:Hypothetical predicted protein [Paramuricea clavata]|uniref:Uncharacterized protein n=1 Tax=Paramuricea clavata TaxID=317549 RepID=A0A6S7H9Q5_PARCT|nr:Hypothetical predicted protein [Paramuricea clavata]
MVFVMMAMMVVMIMIVDAGDDGGGDDDGRVDDAGLCTTGASDNVQEDLDFFKTCIVDYYCFEKNPNKHTWINFPNFKNLIGTTYFNAMAKRIQLFFIRYNTWSNTLVNAKFRDVATGNCLNLLYVIAARYLYVVYVLNKINLEDISFGPCIKHANGDFTVPTNGVCFLTPLNHVTCTSDHDVAMIGKRSGTVASQFNKFFTESVGTDVDIPGFAKTSGDLLDTNVYAFTLEYAMPQAFKGLTGVFKNKVNNFNADLNLIVLEIVTAISKMRTFNPGFFRELLSDSGEFNNRPATKHQLKEKFHGWRDKLRTIVAALAALKRSPYYRSLSFKRQLEMAYVQIAGEIEKHITDIYAQNALREMVMALMYNAEAYHTRGSVRHVVGWTQMGRTDVFSQITINDYWTSILENWADSVKEYNKECVATQALITVCLPKMSKYFWRMLDAMFAAYGKLKPTLQTGLLVVDNSGNTGLRSIMAHWFTNVKRKGLNGIPSDDRLTGMPVGTTSLDAFITAMGCTGQSKTAQLSQECLNTIHGHIRKYNRNMFIQLIDSDTA